MLAELNRLRQIAAECRQRYDDARKKLDAAYAKEPCGREHLAALAIWDKASLNSKRALFNFNAVLQAYEILSARHERISKRAFELSLVKDRGQLENWLAAEREIDDC